jgi:glycosyltransferase involved in cell wall biosynthesis
MRIGLDVSQTGQFKTGCGYFADSLARQLIADDGGRTNTYILYPTFGSGYWDPDWPRTTLNVRNRGNVQRGLGHRKLDQLEAFWIDPPADLESRLGSPDIVHSNNFFCPTRLHRARLVYTLHDLAFASHPEWTTEANWRVCFDGVLGASVHADHIVAVSRYTRTQFLDTFPHYPEQQISVVYEASRFAGPTGGPAPARLAHLPPGQFWLGMGTADPRKNQHRLLTAYARLKQAHETAFPLVLFGSRGRPTDDVDGWITSLGLNGDVERLDYVDDASLQWLYENCFAFCYPSLLEGFGLPVVEAMSLGAAILTSSVTSLPEVVGEAGIRVDPLDVEAIYSGMRVLATDQTALATLRVLARARAAEFSWRGAATQVLDVYQMLVDERRLYNGSHQPTTEGKAILGRGAVEH